MRLLAAILFVMYTSAGCQRPGQTFPAKTPPPAFISLTPALQKATTAYGTLPLREILNELRKAELVDYFPPDEIPNHQVAIDRHHRMVDLVNILESRTGWVYDNSRKTFYRAYATHSLDGPDSFGRPAKSERVPTDPRPSITVSLCFRRLAASVTGWDVHAGATANMIHFVTPDGVRQTWNINQERSYFEPVQTLQDGSAVGQQRGTVTSGLTVDALCARLPGGWFRIDGNMNISSFTGQGLDRANVSLPMQVDAPRGQWARTVLVRGGDLGLDVALKNMGFDLNASGDALELLVRVD